nr:ph-response regulator protein palc [Quercus suber]
MPFPFTLPTTSSILLSDYFDSVTHPSLPLIATTKRSVLKDALKKHKRLLPRDGEAHLPTVQAALTDYIPYLLTTNTASSFRNVSAEQVDLDISKPLEAEWRATLSATIAGREPGRVRFIGVHYEVAFVLSTLAYVHSLLARAQMRTIFDSSAVLSSEQRTGAIGTAMKHLLEAHGIHAYLLSMPTTAASKDAPVDVQPSTISALSSLAMAEATLVVVAKDDSYTAAVADNRNENNTEWMYKAPSIPKVRAHLYARICLAAAEHASQAQGLLARGVAGKVDDDLVKYATDLRRTARAKAARFLAIDAELAGKTGEGLAWLKGAKRELGVSTEPERSKGLRGLKQSWQERREDKHISKSTSSWGLDAGKYEESRVLDMLEQKWDRENSTVNVQVVPPFEPLLAGMPTGREYHRSLEPYTPPVLDGETLTRMRAPPGPEDRPFKGDEEDSGGEESAAAAYSGRSGGLHAPGGAFPGTSNEYIARSGTSNSYY